MRLEFKKLEIKNFLSFGNKAQTINFETGINLIIGEDKDNKKTNGSGKSSLLEAIMFALYGRTTRDINIPQLVNWKNKKGCSVKLEFKKGEHLYKIERGLKPKHLKLFEDGKEIKQEANKRDFQEEIEANVLGIDYASAAALIYSNPNSGNTISLFKTARKNKRALIETLFDLGYFSRLSETCTAKIKTTENKLFNIGSSIETDKGQIATFKEQNTIFKEKIRIIKGKKTSTSDLEKRYKKANIEADKLKDKRNKSLEKIEHFNKLLEGEISLKNKINSKISNLYAVTKNIQAKFIDFDIDYYENLTSSLKKYSDLDEFDLDKIQEKYFNLDNKIKDLNESISELNNKNICPLCKQKVDSSEFKEKNEKRIAKFEKDKDKNKGILDRFKEHSSLKNEIRDLEFKRNEYYNNEKKTNRKKRLENGIAKLQIILDNISNKIEEYEIKIEKYTSINESFEKIINEPEILRKQINDIQKANDQYEEQIIDNKEYIEQNNNRIRELDVNIENALKQKKKLQNLMDYLDYIKNTCKDENVKQFAISNIVPYLNQRVNKYITEAGFNFYLKLDNWLNAEIKGPGIHDSGYGNLSGGESKSVDLAMQLALLDVAKLHSGVFPSILMLDEILDSAVDSQGIEKLMEIVKKKQRDDDSVVFIVSHRKELNELESDHIYKITKEKGFSHIEEV